MKNANMISWTLGVMLGGLPLVGGCTQQNAESTQTNALGILAVSPADTNAPASQPVVGKEADAAGIADVAPAHTHAQAFELTPSQKPEPAGSPTVVQAERQLPANIFFSPALREVVKMAESGIEESVLLAYISNSTRTFNLGADQIIYLNDIGIPDSVVLAMIEHDSQMGVAAAQAATTTTTTAQAQTEAVEPAPQVAQEQYVSAQPEPQPTVVNYNYFYESLAPYGSWISIDGYGLCWQPSVVVIHAGWHPYCHRGRWIYSNWGWYWHSDYTWGRIVFHYGRWFRHPRLGWCWWPDTVWAPAWVVWRYTDYYCGWAPLPPFTGYSVGVGLIYHGRPVGFDFCFGLGADYYTYVSWSRFADHRPYRYRMPYDRIRRVHEQTIVVNNFVQGDNNIVGNIGIPLDRAARFAGREIPRAVIRDLPADAPRREIADRPRWEGDRMIVYREPLAESGFGGRTTGRANLRADSTRPDLGAEMLREIGSRPTRPDISLGRDRLGRHAVPAELRPGAERPIGWDQIVQHGEQPGNENLETAPRQPGTGRPTGPQARTGPQTQMQPSSTVRAATQATGVEPGSQPSRPQPSRVITIGRQRETGQRPERPLSSEIARPLPKPSSGETAPVDTPSASIDMSQPRSSAGSSISRPSISIPAPLSQPSRSEQPNIGVRQSTSARVGPAQRAAPVRTEKAVPFPETRQDAPGTRQTPILRQMPSTRPPVERYVSVPSGRPLSPAQAPAVVPQTRSAPSRLPVVVPAERPSPRPPVERHISVPSAPRPTPPPQPDASALGGRSGGGPDRGMPPRNVRER